MQSWPSLPSISTREHQDAYVSQTRPVKWQNTSAGHGIFKRKIELKKYSRGEYDSMSMAQCQLVCELQKKVGLIKSKKTQKNGSKG